MWIVDQLQLHVIFIFSNKFSSQNINKIVALFKPASYSGIKATAKDVQKVYCRRWKEKNRSGFII